MERTYTYKPVAKLNMLDPKRNIVAKLNKFALIAIIISCGVGALLNYLLRMLGHAGGMYLVYIFLGALLCYVYIYLHEFTHALGILIIKRRAPIIKFDKFAAHCGSPDIIFTRAQYVFVASLPFIFFCAALIPLCVLLPPLYFPLPFMPLTYNFFGSFGDLYMIRRALRTPKGTVIIDYGTEIDLFIENQP